MSDGALLGFMVSAAVGAFMFYRIGYAVGKLTGRRIATEECTARIAQVLSERNM